MAQIVWLLEETVLAIHHRQISEHGGREGFRDEGLLHSALARPQNLLAYAQPQPDLAAPLLRPTLTELLATTRS